MCVIAISISMFRYQSTKEFVFAENGVGPSWRARTLKEFSAILPGLSDEALEGHLRRGDFSRWIEKVFGDFRLASEIRAVEIGQGVGHKFDPRGGHRQANQVAIFSKSLRRPPKLRLRIFANNADEARQ